MKLINLIEDTAGAPGCTPAHGLSFYCETAQHKLLMDLGPGEATLLNAAKLGVDVKAVDTVILSHGHYDHAGGILPFVSRNPRAAIYMQQTACAPFYADDGEAAAPARYRYIGMDAAIKSLPQVKFLTGDTVIDNALELFTVDERVAPLPFPNRRLLLKEGNAFVRDHFEHEQCAVLREGDKCLLLSGCAHSGILNILEAFRKKYGRAPDAVLSGFHLSLKRAYTQNEAEEIRHLAAKLRRYPTAFFTCHCTGEAAFEIMKSIMGEQLHFVHTGQRITLFENTK